MILNCFGRSVFPEFLRVLRSIYVGWQLYLFRNEEARAFSGSLSNIFYDLILISISRYTHLYNDLTVRLNFTVRRMINSLRANYHYVRKDI